MIQADITDPVEITALGDLRRWLASQSHLPDDTQIQVIGHQDGDEVPEIVITKRTWRPKEQGCLVELQPDGSYAQVHQTVIVIREYE